MLPNRVKTAGVDLVANFIVVGFFVAALLAETGLRGGPLAKVDVNMLHSLVSTKAFLLAALGAVIAFALFRYLASASKLRSQRRRGHLLANRVLAQLSSILAGFGSLAFFVAWASESWGIATWWPASWLLAVLVAPSVE